MPSTRPSTADKRKTFRALHQSGCFVIPNPWNVGSARYLQGLGFKALATYVRANRLRLHAHVATRAEENAACTAEYGRSPIALLAEHGVVDKRFTAIDAIHLSEEEVKLLGSARAGVCVCPITVHNLGLGRAPGLVSVGRSLRRGQ